MMVDYTYTKPSSFNRDQLLTEVWADANITPQKLIFDSANVTFTFPSALTAQQESDLEDCVLNHVADEDFIEKQTPWAGITGSFLWAAIDSFAGSNVTVTKTIGTETFTLTTSMSKCFEVLKVAGTIVVGDTALILISPEGPVALTAL